MIKTGHHLSDAEIAFRDKAGLLGRIDRYLFREKKRETVARARQWRLARSEG